MLCFGAEGGGDVLCPVKLCHLPVRAAQKVAGAGLGGEENPRVGAVERVDLVDVEQRRKDHRRVLADPGCRRHCVLTAEERLVDVRRVRAAAVLVDALRPNHVAHLLGAAFAGFNADFDKVDRVLLLGLGGWQLAADERGIFGPHFELNTCELPVRCGGLDWLVFWAVAARVELFENLAHDKLSGAEHLTASLNRDLEHVGPLGRVGERDLV